MDDIRVYARKYLSLKHHIEKMHHFENYIRDPRVAKHLKKAIEYLKNELLESVILDNGKISNHS